MSLIQEYANQNRWRNWQQYIDMLPLESENTVLDLGCSLGFVSKLLAGRAKHVIGVDIDPDLIREANTAHSAPNIEYRIGDLRKVNQLGLPMADGIWSSFSAAYFPDFDSVLDKWLAMLKPGGWIALIEIDDLFGHKPLNQIISTHFRNYYQFQREKGVYDFEMGRKLKSIAESKGLEITHNAAIPDKELSFNGPAEEPILEAWKMRFSRMKALREFLGEQEFKQVCNEFISCLNREDHSCTSEVRFIVARKK